MIRKDVMIAILTTFCLTTTLFIILPTRSSPSAGEYDSWADVNEDGIINMKDIAYTAQKFGASGEPTKYVNVTDLPEPAYRIDQYPAVNLTWGMTHEGLVTWTTPRIIGFSGGYSRLTVEMSAYAYGGLYVNCSTNITAVGILWESQYPDFPQHGMYGDDPRGGFRLFAEPASVIIYGNRAGAEGYVSIIVSGPTEICAPYYMLMIKPFENDAYPMHTWATMNVSVYLRND